MSEHDPKIRSLPRRILGGSIAIVVDLLLVLASLVLVAYFSINTHLGGEIVAQILRRALPSEVEIGRVGITPTLSRVVLVHVAFRHPGAKNETITLDGARVHLRIWPLLRSLLLEEHRLRLELGSIELLRPDVRLAFDKNGALKLLSLFTDGKPSSGPPTRVTLAFQRIVIRDGGKDIACLVPRRDLDVLQNLDDRLDIEAAKRLLQQELDDDA